MKLVTDIYSVTKSFPKEEIYGLISQMRRAAVSIPSNIAEGSQRVSDKEFSNFILIAKGSLSELLTQLHIALELRYGSQIKVNALIIECNELSKMLYSFYSKLRAQRS